LSIDFRSIILTIRDCFNCLSIWITAGITIIIQPDWKDCWAAWLGLSGAACLLNRIGHDPVVMQTIEEGGTDNALLRSESGASEDGGEGAHIAHGGS
jgi:hypothetical protein